MLFDDLRYIQREHGHLTDESLQTLSDRVDVPLYRLQEVASFYPSFHKAPEPALNVGVCSDLVCHMHGADKLKAYINRRFAAVSAKSAAVRGISCLGRCDVAPVISINDVVFGNATKPEAERLIALGLSGSPIPPPPVDNRLVKLKLDPYLELPKYGAVRQIRAGADLEAILSLLKDAAVVGMGGAGFPLHLKWSMVRNSTEKYKYVICNADESEPGTMKDGFLMQHAPHLIIEGMLIAALITGARFGYVYLRHEYETQRAALQEEINYCRTEGLLGASILGSDGPFQIEIFLSPGGYICGESSAMLEAIEGKRAEPRNKPPNSTMRGLWQKPTVVNNVETLAAVPAIVMNGLDWFRAQGQGGAAGLKVVSVSGDVRRPGSFEAPMGIPLTELVMEFAGGPRGGRTIKAFAPSGAAAGFLPASLLNTRLDFKSMSAAGSMLGSGAFIILDDERCMLDMALNALRFLRNESCGKCVPCRIGSHKIVEIVESWTRGSRGQDDLKLIDELCQALRLTSICGLGQFVPNPIESVMKYFAEEVRSHFEDRHCPAQVCQL